MSDRTCSRDASFDCGAPAEAVTAGAFAANLAAVIAGNLLGGSVLVGLVYHLIYRRKP